MSRIDELHDTCTECEAELRDDPDDAVALYNWAVALDEIASLTEDPDERVAILWRVCGKYERAAELDPADVDALTNWGVALGELAAAAEEPSEQRRLFEAEIDKYQRALVLDPDEHDALNNWGVTLGQLAELDRDAGNTDGQRARLELACDKFGHALELEPEEAEVLANRALALAERAGIADDEAEIVALLRAAASDDAHSVTVEPDAGPMHHWGVVLARLAELSSDREHAALLLDAVEKCRLATELDPTMLEAFHDWGACLSQLARATPMPKRAALLREACEKYDVVIDELQDAARTLCDRGTTRGNLAALTPAPGERDRLFDAAFDDFRRASEAEPELADAFEWWANHLVHRYPFHADQPELQRHILVEAQAKLRRAAELRGVAIDHQYDYACMLALAGDRMNALRCLENCLRTGDIAVAHVREDRDWDRFARDPEFDTLLDRYDL